MSKWSDGFATQCGHEVFIHEDWNSPPKYCSDCKAKNDAKWTEVQCSAGGCTNTFRVCLEWNNPPKYCQECKNRYYAQNLACSICSDSFVWSIGSQIKARENHWEAPQKCPTCRNFIKQNLPVQINCKFCYNIIEWMPFQQLMEGHQGWQKITVCKECKEDRKLLIQGALSDFTEKVYVKDEKPLGATSWVAVVYRSRDSKPLAHISIAKSLGEGRVAITTLLTNIPILETSPRHTKTISRFQEGTLATTYGNNKPQKETHIQKPVFENPKAIIRDKLLNTIATRSISRKNKHEEVEEIDK